jgi:hypothetical protein
VYFAISAITTHNPLYLIIAKLELNAGGGRSGDVWMNCRFIAAGWRRRSLQLADVVDIQFLLITKSLCCLF